MSVKMSLDYYLDQIPNAYGAVLWPENFYLGRTQTRLTVGEQFSLYILGLHNLPSIIWKGFCQVAEKMRELM